MPSNHPVLLAVSAFDEESLRRRLAGLVTRSGDRGEAGFSFVPSDGHEASGGAPFRCAIAASGPEDLVAATRVVDVALRAGRRLTLDGPVAVGIGPPSRIGFLFPGQGAPVRSGAGGVGERLSEAAEAFAAAEVPADGGEVRADAVQLSVVASSLAALAALAALRVDADLAVGHSLGELTALHWAQALDAPALLGLARARGRAMTDHAVARGTMATVCADEATVAELTEGVDVAVACVNAPRQRVVSGEIPAVETVVARARERGVRALPLRVVGAFHSPLMHPAIPIFERELAGVRLTAPSRCVVSTVTEGPLDAAADLHALLAGQIAAPVLFAGAAARAAEQADLLIEVGSGSMLVALMREISDVPAISTRAGVDSSAALVEVAAAAFAAGAPVALERLGARASVSVEVSA